VPEMKVVSLDQIAEGLKNAVKPVNVLWQAPDSIAFVARGRVGRSEFHNDPSDEVMYMIRGDMNLHYLTPEGEEKIQVIKEGEIIYCPAGIPHSPRFPSDAMVLVIERKRREGEQDRFSWFCDKCHTRLHDAIRVVSDYGSDPVSSVYKEFYSDEAKRTCSKCGHVAPSM
jgi:3-hydroxyanthranilate 3,4-dioxygenase